ncbi:hypothetical protein CVT24_001348 [Panaeolus cyanescens]|uniref:DUF6534 domain-containing protein n=1 Tax=Panaeolus cyanescens TaxID=181874 RepID=A0A409YFS5_9AGAR|nr:hypothetical protein CVT24_001348 [Panaeolus cyanescens]
MTEATLGNTIGAAFLGLVAASILFGVTAIQVYIYYHNYPKDWRLQKFSVGLLLILDTLHLSLTVHAVYHYLVANFGDLKALQDVVWSFKLQIVINIVIVLYVQGLYTLRIYKLGINIAKVWPILTGIVVLGGYGMLSSDSSAIARATDDGDFSAQSSVSWIIFTCFAAATVIDVVIALAICYYLNRSTSYMFKRTNNRIFTIMKYVVISGFATSACSLSALIALAIMPNTLVFLGIEFLLTKRERLQPESFFLFTHNADVFPLLNSPAVYINSYIALLNARNHLRDKETSRSLSISKIINVQSAMSRGDDDRMLDSPTNKNTAIPLSPTPLLSRSTNHDHYDQRISIKPRLSDPYISQPPIGIVVHRTQERTYDKTDPEANMPRAV